MDNTFREEVQKEAINALLSVKNGTVDISMRLGKSFIGLQIASKFNKVLVAYPNKAILTSWDSDSKKFHLDTSHITFTTFRSLNKHNLQDYDVIIIDEVHATSIANLEYIYYNEPKKLYGLTGTLPTGDKLKYIQRLCPVVYTKQLDSTTGVTNKPYEIIVHMLKPSTISNIKLASGKTWSESQRIAFFNNKWMKSRNFTDMLMLINAIKNSATKMNYLKKLTNTIDRGLIFLETVKQCDEVNLPTYHTKDSNSDKNLEDFKNGIINKLTTINQLQAGITISKLDTIVILHSYASSTKSIQKLGRGLNFDENVIANIHIIVLDKTIDVTWCNKALSTLNQSKITYKYI